MTIVECNYPKKYFQGGGGSISSLGRLNPYPLGGSQAGLHHMLSYTANTTYVLQKMKIIEDH